MIFILTYKGMARHIYTDGGMIKKEIQLFFLSEISVYLSWFFFLYTNNFLMFYNQSEFLILSSITFERVRRKSIQIFQTFGNLEIDSGVSFKNIFDKLSTFLWVTLLFYQNFDSV